MIGFGIAAHVLPFGRVVGYINWFLSCVVLAWEFYHFNRICTTVITERRRKNSTTTVAVVGARVILVRWVGRRAAQSHAPAPGDWTHLGRAPSPHLQMMWSLFGVVDILYVLGYTSPDTNTLLSAMCDWLVRRRDGSVRRRERRRLLMTTPPLR